MMIDAACRQSSYLLPLLTNTGQSSQKMKRSSTHTEKPEVSPSSNTGARIDTQTKMLPPRKKLKFGVDAILGNNSDNDSSFDNGNDSDDDLKHKGKSDSRVKLNDLLSIPLKTHRMKSSFLPV